MSPYSERFVSLCRRHLAVWPSPFKKGMGITRRHERCLGGRGKKVRSPMGLWRISSGDDQGYLATDQIR